MTLDCLYIVMPAYNEAANIARVVSGWYPVIERLGGESRLVVLDDGSSDATAELLRELARTRPQLVALSRGNRGHGATVRELYRYALDHGAGYVFQTDSDGQTDPAEFEAFWEARGGYDLVSGVRTARQDGAGRLVVTRVLRTVVRACFHVSIPDANAPFRLMSASSLERALALVPEGYELANVALSVAYHKLGFRVLELPIAFKPRQGGVNSINLPRIAAMGARALASFVALDREMNRAVARESLREGGERR